MIINVEIEFDVVLICI